MSLRSSAKPPTTQASILSFLQPRSAKPSAATATAPPSAQKPPASQQPAQPPSPSPSPAPPSPPSPAPPSPPSPAPPPPPPNATIRAIAPADLPALKRVNALLLPVPYGDSFYKAAVNPGASGPFSRLITWTDHIDGSSSRGGQRQPPPEPRVIGAIVCKVVPSAWVVSGGETPSSSSSSSSSRPADPDNVLYIQSLCVLAPYRRLGLAAAALQDVVQTAAAEYPELRLGAVCAHVWTENDDGLKWYRSCGFAISDEPLQSYYHQLRPGSAWIARRDLHSTKSAVAANPGGAALSRAQSYQKVGPPTEWNDLPDDMMAARFGPRDAPASSSSAAAATSNASSRSSSSSATTVAAGRRKKEGAYPPAAFGGQ